MVQPSSSPWASPVVLVRKKDNSYRFCIDYRSLNAVTKGDAFPLPRVDDLLDQLGQSKCFSTLDLAAGYWQIPVDEQSREKTAFATPEGLFEFRMLPFGLTNAPAVFQRLMQRVLAGLKSSDGASCVSVYIDDVLIFSRSIEEHLEHLRAVLECIRGAGLKLKLSKCRLLREEVDYLGHMVTPDGLKPNCQLVEAVEEFPVPTTVRQVRRFVGLVSYYRKFIASFARIAHPLYALTKKDVPFIWSSKCQAAFDVLKRQLVESPILVYPDFTKPFHLETDACAQGLGAVLSQLQSDGELHPVAYASRTVSEAEKHYCVTELETLAVVWAISHFHSYLYGHDVTVHTDHTAVKAVLGGTDLHGKHARWWQKVYASGIRKLEIVYRSGKENKHADALSRQPFLPAEDTVEEDEDAMVAVISSEDNGEDTTVKELLLRDCVQLADVATLSASIDLWHSNKRIQR